MKQGKVAMSLMMAVLFAGVIAYFGIYIYRTLNTTIEFATVYESTVEDRTEVYGFVVRDEYVLNQDSNDLMEIMLNDGEKVGVGGTIARIYNDEETAQRYREMESLEEELARLQSLQSGSQDIILLDEQIVSLMETIHMTRSNGAYTDLYTNATSLKDTSFQRDYLNNYIDLDSEISELANRIAQLESESGVDYKSVTTTVSGIYSSYVDGYENLLTSDMLDDLTVSKLASWENYASEIETGDSVGKLIEGQKWYYAITMEQADAARLGSYVSLRFASGFTDSIRMQVVSVSEPENNKVAVVLSCVNYLNETAQLRYLAADILFDTNEGLLVPLSAVHIKTTTADDGAITSERGVYAVVGTQAEWKSVNVLYSDDEYAIVVPTDQSDSNALRAGDTVVSKGKDIYTGKVVTQ